MIDESYRVSQSEALLAKFRKLAEQAKSENRLVAFVKAARWIAEELSRTPSEFGESSEYLANAMIQIRRAFVRPLYVEYGVHEHTRSVFLRKFVLLDPPS